MLKERKGRTDTGEVIAIDFLNSFDLAVEKYPEQSYRTPDFHVTSLDGFYFLVEVKTLVGPGSEQGLIWETLHNRISTEISEASEQFRSVNSHRFVPNVLIFISQDMRIGGRSLNDFFQGYIRITDTINVNLNRQRNGRARKRIPKIDLFIIISHAGTPTFFYTQTDQRFRRKLDRIFTPTQTLILPE